MEDNTGIVVDSNIVAEVPTEPEVISTPTVSEDEVLARKSGWVPKEEFKGDISEWKTAKQFNEYGQLLDHAHQQKRKIQKLTETTEQLVSSIKSIQEKSYQQALADLQAKTRAAVEIGDLDTFERLEQEKEHIKQSIAPIPAPVTPSIPEHIVHAIDQFKKENPWFNHSKTATAKEKAMTAFAAAKEEELLTTGMEYGKILDTIKEEVRKEYPTYFRNPNQTLPTAVASPAGSPPKSQKMTFSDLPAEHQIIVKNLKQTMGSRFNMDNYIADLKRIGAI